MMIIIENKKITPKLKNRNSKTTKRFHNIYFNIKNKKTTKSKNKELLLSKVKVSKLKTVKKITRILQKQIAPNNNQKQ